MGTAAKKKTGARWWERLLPIRSQAKPASESVLFPPEFAATLERLRLAALKALGGGLREGHRLGAYKGGQLEFHGHRNYVPGDELRYVDWNTFARLGKPYVKEFAREEAGVLHLLLDATPSMALGRPSKWNFARRVAALFSHVALASQDSVQICVFREGEKLGRFPAGGARCGIRACLDYLSECELSGTHDAGGPAQPPQARVFEAAVSQFLRSRPQRGRVVVLSDFWQEESEIAAGAGRLAASGFDVSAIHVLAAEEISPAAAGGGLLLREVEHGGAVALQEPPDFEAQYASELEGHLRTAEAAFRKRGGPYLFARSDMPIERVLIAALRQRRWLT